MLEGHRHDAAHRGHIRKDPGYISRIVIDIACPCSAKVLLVVALIVLKASHVTVADHAAWIYILTVLNGGTDRVFHGYELGEVIYSCLFQDCLIRIETDAVVIALVPFPDHLSHVKGDILRR